MRKLNGLLFFSLIFFWGVVDTDAFDFKSTPVQDAFDQQLSMYNYNADQEFDNVNKKKDDKDEDSTIDDFGNKVAVTKSIYKAVFYSALIPGAGEYYLGYKKKARYFFAAEALAWVGFFAFRTYGSWKEDDYIRYGNIHANAQLDDKSEEFHDWVGFYDNTEHFNSEGRVGDPERAYLPPDDPYWHWRWQSEEEQAIYRDLKNRSREAYRRANFMIGAMIFNRIISIIDTIRDAKREQRKISGFGENEDNSSKFKVVVNPFKESNQLQITFYPAF